MCARLRIVLEAVLITCQQMALNRKTGENYIAKPLAYRRNLYNVCVPPEYLANFSTMESVRNVMLLLFSAYTFSLFIVLLFT